MKLELHNFLIREAILADAADICDLAGQLGYPDQTETIKIRLKNILNSPGHKIFLAETEGTRVSGFIHIHIHTSLVIDPVIEIGSLVVDKDFHRMGIGKALLSAAEEWSKAEGYKMIRLHSNIIRSEAHRFYEAQGYSIIKTQHSFIKNLD
jgi:GNAT superfamily N-acetyltransferase